MRQLWFRGTILLAVVLVIGCGSRKTTNPPKGAVSASSTPEEALRETDISSGAENDSVKPRGFSRVKVLLIAVDDYKSSEVSPLPRPISEAKQLKTLFENQYGYKVDELFGKKATKAAIEAKIISLDDELGDQDALIVHFGGHGRAIKPSFPDLERKGYLLPYDSTLSNSKPPPKGGDWKSSVIEMSGFSQRLVELTIGHVVLFADCCSSGFLTQTGTRGGQIGGRRDLHLSVRNPSCSIVTAGTSDAEIDGGIFTPSLMRELTVRKAKSLYEVVVGMNRSVSAGNLSLRHAQRRPDGGDFVFIPLAVPEELVDVEIKQADRELQARHMELTTLREALSAFDAPDYRLGNNPFGEHDKWKNRFEILRKKAGVDNPVDGLAKFGVYQCYVKGLGVEGVDEEKAYRVAQSAYENGSAIGKFLMGDAFYRGIHVAENKIAGLRLIEEAAKGGSPIAKFVLGDILLRRGQAESVKRGLELLEEASKEGVINADIALAQAYSGVFSNYKASKIPTNIDRSIKAIQKVIDDDNRPAEGSYQGFLMQETFREQFRNVIPKERLALLLDASHRGFPDAQVDLAKVYLFRWEDYGFHADEGAARDLLLAAAKANNRVAHDMLSFYYSQGELVDLDYELAKEHGMKAANLGSGQASRRLGVWYYDGNVVEQDYAKAFQFFRKAASQNDAEGCKCLASMFDRGEGYAASLTKPEQLSEATHWLMKACELGDAKALDYFVSNVTNKFSHISWRGAERLIWKTHADSALTMIRRAAYRARYISGRKPRSLPSEGAPKNWSQLQPENPDTVYIGGFTVGENTKASFYAAESFISSHSEFLEAWFGRYSGEEKQTAIKQIDGGLEGTVSGTFHEPAWLDEKEHSQSGYKTVALDLDGGMVCDLTGPSKEVDAARDAFIAYAKSL